MGRRSKKKAAYRREAQQAAGRPANPAPLWRSSAWKLGVAGVGTLLLVGLIALLVLSSSSEELSQTSVPGIYAAGDMARRPAFPFPAAQVIHAASAGGIAAVVAERELLWAEVEGGTAVAG